MSGEILDKVLRNHQKTLDLVKEQGEDLEILITRFRWEKDEDTTKNTGILKDRSKDLRFRL